MNGKEAYVALANGQKVKRKLWDALGMKGCYLYINKEDGLVWSNIAGHKSMYLFDCFDKYEIYEEERNYLDDEEKAYLNVIIKPFKDKVKGITKNTLLGDCQFSYISISVENNMPIELPIFPTDDMYRNMTLNYKYTLKELKL